MNKKIGHVKIKNSRRIPFNLCLHPGRGLARAEETMCWSRCFGEPRGSNYQGTREGYQLHSPANPPPAGRTPCSPLGVVSSVVPHHRAVSEDE